MLTLSTARLRTLERAGIVRPQSGPRGALRLGFRDLVMIRLMSGLMRSGISSRRVIRSLTRLQRRLPPGQSLSELRIVAQGDRILVFEQGVPCDIETGQFVLDFDVAAADGRVSALPDRLRPQTDDDSDAEAWYTLGTELEDSSPLDGRRAYESALERNPDHADARVNLGRLLHEGGRPADAAWHYRRALAANPTHATAAFNLGVALEDQRLWTEAASAYERAIELFPALADAHYNLAAIRERQGDRQGALRALRRYRELTDSPVAR